jgi:Xaa-Pro aminopeptidase
MSHSKLTKLRQELNKHGVDGFLIPSNDEFLGEYVAEYAARLKWLTGFSGSNGIAVVTKEKAAFFTDGRYTLQAAEELDPALYEIYNFQDKQIAKWLEECSTSNIKIAYDPWLFTEKQIENLSSSDTVTIVPSSINFIDLIWKERPPKQASEIFIHPKEYHGENSLSKREKIANQLAVQKIDAALITAPDSVCWLLNIRGRDLDYTPIILARAIIYVDAKVELFVDTNNLSKSIREHLGNDVILYPLSELDKIINTLANKKIRLDTSLSPFFFTHTLLNSKAIIAKGTDPCQLPKARKNDIEINQAQTAHLQDAIALCNFLSWFEQSITEQRYLTEMDAASKLLEFRQHQSNFVTPSFATIAGFRENGAIIHYHPTYKTNKQITADGLFLLDSGGQYFSGTTDITRTILVGKATEEQKINYTLVLKGHINLAQAIFPRGTTGSQLDVLARLPLWKRGLEYNHGTGHGVGQFLSVHEGPQSISQRASMVALEPGMILSNEPGFYQTGEYGIRIENLVYVATTLINNKEFLCFKNLTMVPFDYRLIDTSLLSQNEIAWVNNYHNQIQHTLSNAVKDDCVRDWLHKFTAPLK